MSPLKITERVDSISDGLVQAICLAGALFGVAALFGHTLEVPILRTFGFSKAPVHIISAVLIALLYCALLAFIRGRPPLTRIYCIAALLVSVVGAIGRFTAAAPLSFGAGDVLPVIGRFDDLATVSPQAIVIGLFFSVAFLLLIRADSIMTVLWSGLLALVSVVLCGSVLFGHALGVRAAVSWGHASAMSPISAMLFIVFGVAFGELLWRSRLRFEQSAPETWRQFVLVAVAGAAVTTLIASIFAVLPLYSRLEIVRTQALRSELQSRVEAFTRLGAELQISAARISARGSGVALEGFIRGKISQTEYADFFKHENEMLLVDHRSLQGLVRIDLNGNELARVGRPLDYRPPVLPPDQKLYPSIWTGKELLFLVVTPIALRDETTNVAWDLAFFVPSEIEKFLKPLDEYKTTNSLLLVKPLPAGKIELLGLSPELTELHANNTFLSAFRSYSSKKTTASVERSVLPVVRVFLPIENDDRYLAYEIPSDILQKEESEKLLSFFLSVLLFAVFGSAGIYFAVNHLLQRTALLQSEVKENIAERKQAEMALRASLREKELLLQEVHHRVKNNLQVISSLLGLQARGLADKESRDAFERSQNRVKSIALLHDLLYKSGDFARIDFRLYVDRLLSRALDSLGAAERITLDLQVDNEALLGLDVAIPCGLIINELATNAVTHAFVGRDTGTLRIVFRRDGDFYELLVQDDGRGFSANHRDEAPSSLGVRLIQSLVHQLDGKSTIESENGTKWTIRFPVPAVAVIPVPAPETIQGVRVNES